MEIRDALDRDLPGILQIYNDVIATSTAVYTEEASTLEERRAWLAARRREGFPTLVAEDERGVSGFAFFRDWRGSWPGNRHTVEHLVHVRADARGKGVGTALMLALIERGAASGRHAVVGAIDAANGPSLRFHERLGFFEVARFREVGRKFDRWLDLVFVQRFFDREGGEPGLPS